MRKSFQRDGGFQEADVGVLLERSILFFKSVMGRRAIDCEYDQRRTCSLQKAAAPDGFIVRVRDQHQHSAELFGISVQRAFPLLLSSFNRRFAYSAARILMAISRSSL